MNDLPVSIQELHENACAEKKFFYADPDTGARVFTRLFHLNRGSCCGNACRHCPYNHENVPANEG